MIGWSRATAVPVEQALGAGDLKVVDAGVAVAHQAVVIELPVLVAIRAGPVVGVVVEFVCEADGDAVFGEGPELLDQAVVQFAVPLAGEEGDNGWTAAQEFVAIAPIAVRGVGQRDPFGVAGVPAILGATHLLE